MAARARWLRRWRYREIISQVDHETVLDRIESDSGWSHRYAFMILMSAGIAILGLLLSSPAVIIGAMLISPLMGPIIGLGFALAIFDWPHVRRALVALLAGSLLATGFTALIVLMSPLQDITPEILARTRPNLFDLLVATFSALAGGYAMVRGRGETIVGVAIATALMPPLAVVGYGLATGNGAVFGGALALFLTNFIAIALSGTLVAKFYGFGAHLSPEQTRLQAWSLIAVFVLLAIPLAFALRQIAWETWAARTARTALTEQFGASARIGTLEPEFGAAGSPLRFRATVFTDAYNPEAETSLTESLSKALGRDVEMRISQITVNQDMASMELDRRRLARNELADRAATRVSMADRISIATSTLPEHVVIDFENRRAHVRAIGPRPLTDWRAVEARLEREYPDWTIQVVPPYQPLPQIMFAAEGATLDTVAQARLQASRWALQRWGVDVIRLTAGRVSDEPVEIAEARLQTVQQALAPLVAEESALIAVNRARERDMGLDAARVVTILPVRDSGTLEVQPETEAPEDAAGNSSEDGNASSGSSAQPRPKLG